MDKNKLRVILNCIYNAQNSIFLLDFDNSEFQDKELKSMYHQLTDMIAIICDKLELQE